MGLSVVGKPQAVVMTSRSLRIEHPTGVVDQVLVGIEGFMGEFRLMIQPDKVEGCEWLQGWMTWS